MVDFSEFRDESFAIPCKVTSVKLGISDIINAVKELCNEAGMGEPIQYNVIFHDQGVTIDIWTPVESLPHV